MRQHGTGRSDERRQYLTFTLGDELYGVDILRVQEIRGWAGVTPLPNTPPHVRGIMNLRGTIVPVVDLRLRLGMPPVEHNAFTVIVVVTVGQTVAGLVVDAVSDVLDVAEDDVQPPPDLGAGVDVGSMVGIARAGERLVVLLELQRVVDQAAVGAARAGASAESVVA